MTKSRDPNRGVAPGQVREPADGVQLRVIATRYIPHDENGQDWHSDVLLEVLKSDASEYEVGKHLRRRAGTVANYRKVQVA